MGTRSLGVGILNALPVLLGLPAIFRKGKSLIAKQCGAFRSLRSRGTRRRDACRITYAPSAPLRSVLLALLHLLMLHHHLLHGATSTLTTLRLRCGLAALGASLASGLLCSLLHRSHFFFPFFLRDLPAAESAIAIACFWGFPAFISLRMFEEIVFWELPFLSGIVSHRVEMSTECCERLRRAGKDAFQYTVNPEQRA